LTAALVLALTAALLLAAAAPASALTRKQAAKRALSALGSKKGTRPVIVFGLTKALRADARVTQAGSKARVARIRHGRAFFFYEDSAPFQPYRHAGRVALVGAKGKVRLSKTIMRAPLVNGRLPAFLKSSKGYRSSQYRVFSRSMTLSAPPKAEKQDVTVKKNRPKTITLTASDADSDMLLYAITNPPDHGTLSGVPPNVVYTPNANYLGKDKFAFKAYDDTSQSNTAHITIDVVPLGSPPVVAASAGCTAYTEHTLAVVVDSGLTATDPDDTVLDSARVRISANFQDGDDLLFTDQNGISSSYDDLTGVLALTGDASVANYQTALRSVRYRNLSSRNLASSKGITFTANDAGTDSAPTTKQICTTGGSAGGNDKPNGEPSEGALAYTENDGPVPIDPGFILGDPDSAQLSGATVQLIARVGKPAEDDELGQPGNTTPDSAFHTGEDLLSFTDLDNGISGSYDSDTGKFTLTGTASVAAYETALRSVTYENTSENPSADTRTARFQVTDLDGLNSTASTRDIFVTPVNDAPVVTTSEGSASYIGTGPGTTIDPDLTVGDVDDTNIEGARVEISSGFVSGDDLIYVDQLSIDGDYNTTSGVLTLTGSAPLADYQTALRSIKYRFTEGNAADSRAVEFTVNDGDLDGAAPKNIAVNDPPVLDTTDAALSYSEGDGPVAIDPGITATDADSSTLQGVTVHITSNSSPGDALVFPGQPGITGFFDEETGVLSLSGTASLADYETALRSVTFENPSDTPSPDARTVTFQADDGGTGNNFSDPVTRDIEVTPVDDAPVVTTSDGSAPYTAGDTVGQAVDGGVSVTDVDDTDIEGATVRLSTGFEEGDALVFAPQLGITGDYDAVSGVLSLSGSAPLADYETALRSIAFRTTVAEPALTREVEFTVNDGDLGSAAALKAIAITIPPPPPPD
jgi:hypothetical protein